MHVYNPCVIGLYQWIWITLWYTRVLSRNEFFLGGKMVRGKCALSRGLGPSPQESVSVPLSKHIYSSVSTSRQELSQWHYFKLQLRKLLGGSLSVWGRAPPVDWTLYTHLDYFQVIFTSSKLCALKLASMLLFCGSDGWYSSRYVYM